jgi:cell division protein FtsN
MRLEGYLTDLLYAHDCVIVPGFGGLVANYRGARLNKTTHVIYPPSKHVGFNRHLIQNDGLLANHIAMITGSSYVEATKELDRLVTEFKNQLQKQGRASWEKIGVFFNDNNGTLQFIPEEQNNFLPDSFGLSAIQLQPVAKTIIPMEIETKQEEEKVVKMTPQTKSNWKWIAAVAIPIAAGATIWLGSTKIHGNFDFASMNPFQKHEVQAKYKMLTPNERSVDSFPNETGWSEALNQMPGASIITYDFAEDKITDVGIDVIIEKPVAKADTTSTKFTKPDVKVDVSSPSGRFKVIAGAFAVESNAEKMIAELTAAGYQAHFAGKRGPLHLVAFGSFDSEAEAKQVLLKVRSEGRSAWIKK